MKASFLTIIFWRDIPSQVTARFGKKCVKKLLSHRFQETIDLAAMKANAHNNNDYLKHWRRSKPIECDADLEHELNKKIQDLEINYDDKKLETLIETGGYNLKKND